jgi:hypothetical protein
MTTRPETSKAAAESTAEDPIEKSFRRQGWTNARLPAE